MFFREQNGKRRIAVVSAHPDDETFGAGGTLARYILQGAEVHVCVVTKGYTPDWTEEYLETAPCQAEEALKILGVASVRFLGFPTVKLNTVPGKELIDKLAEFIGNIDPQVVYSPFPGDLNSDHGIVARSTAIASRPTPKQKRSLLYFETLSSTEWGEMYMHTNFRPNIYVDINSTIERKLEAAACYKLETREYPHPRSLEGIKALAKARGLEVGLEAAEAFMLAVHVS
jgi:LmbE family N-acetylglucosaminyl deacetylase